MFFKRSKRKKDRERAVYSSLRLLYFNKPVDEKVIAAINHENNTLELFWDNELYVMSMDRLAVSYYDNIYASFLAQGRQIFARDWPVMQNLLLKEKEMREQENTLKTKDGLKLTYRMKENGELICLLTSEVFFQTVEMWKELKACVRDGGYTKIEL